MGCFLSFIYNNKNSKKNDIINEKKYIIKWFDSNIISSIYTTIDNKLEGECLLFDKNGILHTKNFYKNGKKYGEQISYNCYLYNSNKAYIVKKYISIYNNENEMKCIEII